MMKLPILPGPHPPYTTSVSPGMAAPPHPDSPPSPPLSARLLAPALLSSPRLVAVYTTAMVVMDRIQIIKGKAF